MELKISEMHQIERPKKGKEVGGYWESKNIGGPLVPKYLVIHYTAGYTPEGAIDWLSRKDSKVSAHLVVGRDGSITQLVPFNRIAFHAGLSAWEGLSGLNNYSIGIELDNAGRLYKKHNEWVGPFGKKIKHSEVLLATHKYDAKEYGWHSFPEAQINSAVEISLALIEKYGLLDVVGHDDISPRRKWDPGPAFPMDSFRSKVMGRMEDSPVFFTTTDKVTIHNPLNKNSAGEIIGKLEKGTRVELLEHYLYWSHVVVVDATSELTGVTGWVSSCFLTREENDNAE